MKRDSPSFDRSAPPLRSNRQPATKKHRLDEAASSVAAGLLRLSGTTASIAAGCKTISSPRWKKIAASCILDPLWAYINGINTRVADMQLSFGSLNNQLNVGPTVQPENIPMVAQQDRLHNSASYILGFSCALLVPHQTMSLHFSNGNPVVYQTARRLFADKDLWVALPDAEDARRPRHSQPHRRGRLLAADYVRVNTGLRGNFLGFRIQMKSPMAASNNARTGHLAMRLRRKKGTGEDLYFLFATPVKNMPITIVVYHDQGRMVADNPEAARPIIPTEGVRVRPNGSKEYVAYYDLLWLYAAASFEGRLFPFNPDQMAKTFHRLTGVQNLEQTWNATLDVFMQRVPKPHSEFSPIYLSYLARNRHYNLKSSVRNTVSIPGDLIEGPSFVAPVASGVPSIETWLEALKEPVPPITDEDWEALVNGVRAA